jgi:glycosyltransferase involved in cell wall biosynthesis
MIGHNPGRVTTQGEILSRKFCENGYPVTSVSQYNNRYARLADVIGTLIRSRRDVDILMLQVYAERSFVVEDIASALSKRFGHRIIMILRGGTIQQFMNRFPQWSRRVFRRAHALVAPSNFLASAVAKHGFHVSIIPNVIDCSRYPYRQRTAVKPKLLWMRAFYDYYNPILAVRVLARLTREFPDANLVMAGPELGDELRVKRLVKQLRLETRVRFAGFLNHAAKVREFGEADIFLNTNTIDNMPVSVIEACAFGLPVVATAIGGIPDFLTDGDTALLVPNNDDEAMAAAVIGLLTNPPLVARLSTNGRQLAERSSWDNVHSHWEELFAEVLGR